MKINLDQPILQLDGSEFNEKMTLKSACFLGVTTPMKGDEALSIEKKLEMFKIAQTVHLGGVVELTIEQIALLKERIGHAFTVVVVGRAFDMLERSA